MKTKLLFICTANMDRSPTAAELFKNSREYEAKSAGFYPPLEGVKITKKLVSWADVLFVMEEIQEGHRTALLRGFPEAYDKKVIVLDIHNDYYKNEPRLVELLKEKLKEEGFWK